MMDLTTMVLNIVTTVVLNIGHWTLGQEKKWQMMEGT